MRIALTLLAGGLILASGPALVSGIPSEPGEEAEVEWESLANPLVVFLPEDYSAEKKWPVVFHYHGTSGVPTTGMPRRYTDGRDFVIVGMEYVTRGKVAPEVDYLELEIELLREVRSWLAARISIDPARTVVGGFSKGGWIASEMAEQYAADFSGVYVLGAGKNWRRIRKAVPIRRKLPIYIGSGQFDPNNPYSFRAADYFRELGGVPFLDEYLGEAHTLPMRERSEVFVQWWKLLAGGDALKDEAHEWAKGAILRAREEKDELLSFLQLDRAMRAPFHVRLSEAERGFLESEWKAAGRALPEDERKARARYETNRLSEAKSGTLDLLQKVAAGYHRIAADFPETLHGQRAAVDYARLRETVVEVEPGMFRDEESKRRYLEDLDKNPLPDPLPVKGRDYFRKIGAAIQP